MTVASKLRLAGLTLILVGSAVVITNGSINITKNNRSIELNQNRPSPDWSATQRDEHRWNDLTERWQAAENASSWQSHLLLLSYITMFFTGIFIVAITRNHSVESPLRYCGEGATPQ